VTPRFVRRGCARLVVLVLLVLVALVGYQLVSWPDVRALVHSNPQTTAFIERYQKQLHERGLPERVSWSWVPYSRISPHLKRAVLVGEDINFFSHRGFDTGEIREAIRTAWQEHEFPRGASTITQQVAKNLWLSPSATPIRKLREALLTRQLEKFLDKRRILELYLNVAEFGPGIYGAEAAARRYFGKAAADLSPGEAAQLAAALPRPSTWNPESASRAYRRQVRSIRTRMDRATFLWKQIE
jgi:monofunctional glycosyltransferase